MFSACLSETSLHAPDLASKLCSLTCKGVLNPGRGVWGSEPHIRVAASAEVLASELRQVLEAMCQVIIKLAGPAAAYTEVITHALSPMTHRRLLSAYETLTVTILQARPAQSGVWP